MANKSLLAGWPLARKIGATCFIVTLLLGYLIAVLQIYDRSHFDMQKTVQYYRGEESKDPNSIFMPQSFTSMLSVSHVHTLSQPLMFGLLALIFSFSILSEKTKAVFIILGFSGSVLSNLAPWLIRYVAGGNVTLLPISQTMMMLSLMVMGIISIKEMWV